MIYYEDMASSSTSSTSSTSSIYDLDWDTTTAGYKITMNSSVDDFFNYTYSSGQTTLLKTSVSLTDAGYDINDFIRKKCEYNFKWKYFGDEYRDVCSARIIRRKDYKNRISEIIRDRQGPGIIIARSHMRNPEDIREERARQTLKMLIGEDRYKCFLKNGFISAKNPKSGKVYQIFTGTTTTRVYENGKLTAILCVVLKGKFPPTDTMIVRYLLALNDEEKLWRLALDGVSTQIFDAPRENPMKSRLEREEPKPLVEIFSNLKSVA